MLHSQMLTWWEKKIDGEMPASRRHSERTLSIASSTATRGSSKVKLSFD